MDTPEDLSKKYQMLAGYLDERALRLCLAADALTLGHGGATIVAKAAKVSRTTVHAGMTELRGEQPVEELRKTTNGQTRIRNLGAGRKMLKEKDKELLLDLEGLLDPVTRGDPMAPLRWTAKSTTKLTEELRAKGHAVSQPTVWRLLDGLGYSMQSNRKTREGTDHPDRNAQFEFIGDTVQDFLARRLPVISVDTKKKELIGNYKNAGREWQRKEEPVEVNMHDFPDPELGKAIPYGVYDIGRNEGWVSIGVTHDTAEFAVATIRRWWLKMGRMVYPEAKEFLITADGGGSNGVRIRLWKKELQRLADDLGITVHVRHFPPGTSKWNKIEHRMFCHITENWRARPLNNLITIINLIGNTSTKTGLTIHAELDDNHYTTGQRVEDDIMASLAITRCEFHGEWNYRVAPAGPKP
jgi:hypothetical protein